MDQTIQRHKPEENFSYSPPFRDVKLPFFGVCISVRDYYAEIGFYWKRSGTKIDF